MNSSSPDFNPQPVTLEGKGVRLEPIGPQHVEDLFYFGKEKSVWTYMSRPHFKNIRDAGDWVQGAVSEVETGCAVVFANIDRETGKAVGSTRYFDIRRKDRGLEIGWTWMGIPYQRTVMNTESKFLLLRHAFEDLGALRVQLKTDSRNLKSQKAMDRIGCKREGILRNQMVLWNGVIRDSVYYSVLEKEWPAVKKNLLKLLSSA